MRRPEQESNFKAATIAAEYSLICIIRLKHHWNIHISPWLFLRQVLNYNRHIKYTLILDTAQNTQNARFFNRAFLFYNIVNLQYSIWRSPPAVPIYSKKRSRIRSRVCFCKKVYTVIFSKSDAGCLQRGHMKSAGSSSPSYS